MSTQNIIKWKLDLYDVIKRHREFARENGIRWGQYDCAILAADAVLAQTGDDFASAYRGKYATRSAGMSLVQADGFKDYVDVFARRLPEIEVGACRTGDIAVMDGDSAAAMGIIDGVMIHAYYMLPGGRTEDAGFGPFHLDNAKRVFQVRNR